MICVSERPYGMEPTSVTQSLSLPTPGAFMSLYLGHTRVLCPAFLSPFIYIVTHLPGGGSLFAIHGDCEAYDTRTDRWHVVASMSTRRARVGVAAVGNRLYAVGG